VLISTIRAVVDGREDPRGELRRTAAVDELQQRVHIGPIVPGQRSGERRIEARPFQPPLAPGNDADEAGTQPTVR